MTAVMAHAITKTGSRFCAHIFLENIIFQIGRTGAITPVACLRPVNLGGSLIKRASLHNEDFMKKLLSALLLTSFLFGQDKLITVSGSTYEGEYLRKTENGVLFHAKGIINPQDIALTQIDRLILSDGTLFIDYGEFTDGTKKVDVSKEEPSKRGSGNF